MSKLILVPEFEIRRQLFAEIYQRFAQPKTARRAFVVMEAAITCLARDGYDADTLERIARSAGVTRPLIRYYFGSLDELKNVSTRYVRLLFQKMAIDAILGGTDAADRLDRYVDACFAWTERSRTHARVWFRFLLDGSRSKKGRRLNSEAVRRGEERLAALLERGRAENAFAFEDLRITAKLVQTMITGAVVTYGCENVPDPAGYRADVRAACRRLVGARPSISAGA